MKNVIFLIITAFVMFSGCISVDGDLPVIYDKPVIKSFTATSFIISPGEASTLSWSVAGATSVSIDQGIGNVALNGATSISPAATTVYTLTAVNSFGSTTARIQITVRGSASAELDQHVRDKPVINYFMITPVAITAGEPAMLTWSVTGATEIKIIPEIVSPEPEVAITIYPAVTTTYTLVAANSAGSVTQSLTVVVSAGDTMQSPSPSGEQIAILSLVFSESGSLVKNAAVYTRQTGICAGDNAQNLPIRAFLSFDISTIPFNAVINEARLDFGTYVISGSPTYSTAMWGNMGALDIFYYPYGKAEDLGRIEYEAPATAISSLRLTDDVDVPLSMDVTLDSLGNNVIQNALNEGKQRAQFRMQFFTSTNWDSKADTICLDEPTLRVKYVLK